MIVSYLFPHHLIGFSDSLGDYNVNCCHTDVSLFVRISILEYVRGSVLSHLRDFLCSLSLVNDVVAHRKLSPQAVELGCRPIIPLLRTLNTPYHRRIVLVQIWTRSHSENCMDRQWAPSVNMSRLARKNELIRETAWDQHNFPLTNSADFVSLLLCAAGQQMYYTKLLLEIKLSQEDALV